MQQRALDGAGSGSSLTPPPFQLKAVNEGAGNDASAGDLSQTGLPAQLKAGIEQMSGIDMGDVTVHRNSSKPAEVGAHAYTQGADIYLGPGQEKHLPHEAWHVVQQKQGRVQANTSVKGAAMNNDAALESEADSKGAEAMQKKVDGAYRSMALATRSVLRGGIQAKMMPIQMKALETHGGEWETEEYDLRTDKGSDGTAYPAALGVRGLNIRLKFSPKHPADATKIGLTQTAQSKSGTTTPFIDGNANRESRAITSGSERGLMIDRADARNNPIYGARSMSATETLRDTPQDNNSSSSATSVGNPNLAGSGANATYQLGYRKQNGKTWDTKDAKLFDGPTLSNVAKNSSQTFETTALAIEGNQEGTYYGSVRWGWQTDNDGNFTKIDFSVVSMGAPSAAFNRAAAVWNGAKDSTGADTLNLPIHEIYTVTNPVSMQESGSADRVELPAGTRVIFKRWNRSMGNFVEVEVCDGPLTGKKGTVYQGNLRHEQNGFPPLGPGVPEGDGGSSGPVIV
jgi:Domain of unknown function (DUF4157)